MQAGAIMLSNICAAAFFGFCLQLDWGLQVFAHAAPIAPRGSGPLANLKCLIPHSPRPSKIGCLDQANNPGAILSQRNNWRLRETGLSIRIAADRFVLSSATKPPPDSGPGLDGR